MAEAVTRTENSSSNTMRNGSHRTYQVKATS
jgi:hypothetical protein